LVCKIEKLRDEALLGRFELGGKFELGGSTLLRFGRLDEEQVLGSQCMCFG